MRLWFVVCATLLSSCKSFYGNMAEKYCEKYPYECNTTQIITTDTVNYFTSDTIRVLDTSISAQTRRVIDSFFHLRSKDTIVIEKGGNTIYIERDGNNFKAQVDVNDSLVKIIERQQIENTRLREVNTTIKKETVKTIRKQVPIWKLVLAGVSVAFVLVLLAIYLRQ